MSGMSSLVAWELAACRHAGNCVEQDVQHGATAAYTINTYIVLCGL